MEKISSIPNRENCFYGIRNDRLLVIIERKVIPYENNGVCYPFCVEFRCPKNGNLFTTYHRKEMITGTDIEEMFHDWLYS